MPYWMKNNYPLQVTCIAIRLLATTVIVLLITPTLMAGEEPAEIDIPAPQKIIDLLPYTATYSSSFNGIDAEMQRTLKKVNKHDWQLRNYASVLFIKVEEKSHFSIKQNTLTPKKYWYTNSASSKRNSDLQFNSTATTATDKLQGNTAIELPPNSFDKLSYQSQLRLDLLNNNGQLSTDEFHLVDKKRVKTYKVIMLGKEQIETPAGRFNAVQLQQFRPGKDDYTIIWLAVDWDYFVLQTERVEDGKVEFKVNLNSAIIDGKTIHGL